MIFKKLAENLPMVPMQKIAHHLNSRSIYNGHFVLMILHRVQNENFKEPVGLQPPKKAHTKKVKSKVNHH